MKIGKKIEKEKKFKITVFRPKEGLKNKTDEIELELFLRENLKKEKDLKISNEMMPYFIDKHNKSYLIKLRNGRKLVGFFSGFPEKKTVLRVDLMLLARKARGLAGYQIEMLERLKGVAKEDGFKKMEIEAKTNISVGLRRSCGFEFKDEKNKSTKSGKFHVLELDLE